jgi:hypothetical protein
LICIHRYIITKTEIKVKGPKTLLVILKFDYATEEAIAGVPQLASVK